MPTQEEQTKDIQKSLTDIYGRVQTEGITDKAGKTLLAPGSVITSESVKPSSPIPYVSPEPQPIPSAAGLTTTSDPNLTPPMVKTPAETEAQGFTDQLKALNESLIGESAFKTTQEKEQDIAGKTQTLNDLTNQLNLLQAEEKQIPLSIQQEFTGRGVTAAGVAPIQTARLRDNAIRALGVSAMLNAAQGNLATANDLVDRATKAKFDPIREEINAKTANLKLILESPDATITEKNRAQAQIDIQKAKKKETEKQESEQKEIWNVATTAAQNGADALILQKIQQAKTKEEALQIAGEAGLFKKAIAPSSTSIVDIKGRKLLINDLTGETIKDLGESGTAEKIDMTSYLAEQGIPFTVASDSGKLTKTALNKVTQALGGNLDLAQTIWEEMKSGKNFEQIRQMMREANLDLGLLDKFVQALQEKDAFVNPYD